MVVNANKSIVGQYASRSALTGRLSSFSASWSSTGDSSDASVIVTCRAIPGKERNDGEYGWPSGSGDVSLSSWKTRMYRSRGATLF